MNTVSWLKNIDKFKIALEAEDITNATNKEMKKTIGSRISDANTTPSDDRPEEDLEKTDDIFDLKKDDSDNEKSSDASDNTEEENLEKTDDIFDTGNDDQNDSSESGDEETSEDPNMNDDQSEKDLVENPNSADSLDLAFSDKNRIRDNMIQLYNIISGDIELLTSSINSIDNIDTVSVINTVLNHFRNSKDILYKTLTQELQKSSYDELLQKYITIKRIYDISITMIETHFKKTQPKK